MNIYIEGEILILNTIELLEINKRVWISHDSLILTETKDLYIHKKAQFVCQPSPNNGYVIPVTKKSENDLTLHVTEVKFAFNVTLPKHLMEIDLSDYHHLGNVTMQKQTDERDWIRRSTIYELFDALTKCILLDTYPMEHLICIHETFIQRIMICDNHDLLEEIKVFVYRGFKTEELFSEEVSEDDLKQLTLQLHKRVDEIQHLLDSLIQSVEQTIKQLPAEETEKSMQADLDAATEKEEWLKVKEIRQNMINKGFTPRDE